MLIKWLKYLSINNGLILVDLSDAITLPKTNIAPKIGHLPISPRKKKKWSSNHQFPGVFAVTFGKGEIIVANTAAEGFLAHCMKL